MLTGCCAPTAVLKTLEELVDESDDVGGTVDVFLSIVVCCSKLDVKSVFIDELLLVAIIVALATVLVGSYLNTLLDEVVDVTDDGV